MTHEFSTEIFYQIGEEKFTLDVEFSAEIRAENSGIGGYEYWGFRGYDEGENYFEIDDITWNKEEFSEIENEYIQQYVEDEKTGPKLEEKIIEDFEYYIESTYEPSNYDRDDYE